MGRALRSSEKVLAWIDEHFEESAIDVQKMPALPGGYMVTDGNGHSMIVWYDILNDAVKYKIADIAD